MECMTHRIDEKTLTVIEVIFICNTGDIRLCFYAKEH
jgi:hypothetical protein